MYNISYKILFCFFLRAGDSTQGLTLVVGSIDPTTRPGGISQHYGRQRQVNQFKAVLYYAGSSRPAGTWDLLTKSKTMTVLGHSSVMV